MRKLIAAMGDQLSSPAWMADATIFVAGAAFGALSVLVALSSLA